MNEHLPSSPAAWAVLFFVALLGAVSAQGQSETGLVVIRFPDIESVVVVEGLNEERQALQLIAPADQLAHLVPVAWPAGQPALPDRLQTLRIAFVEEANEDGTIPVIPEVARAARIFRTCEKMALLAQAKPGFELSLTLGVLNGLSDFRQFHDQRWHLDLERNRLTCALKKTS